MKNLILVAVVSGTIARKPYKSLPNCNVWLTKSVTENNLIAYLQDTFEQNASLTLIVENGTGPYLFYIDGAAFEDATVYTELSPGTHIIRVIDANDCNDLTKEILVLDYPKYFTPNSDGYHDSWNILRLSNQPDACIYIYDRYGKLLKMIKPSGEGWNGSFGGRDLPSDDYWFTVDYKEPNIKGILEWKKYKSHFSLKR